MKRIRLKATEHFPRLVTKVDDDDYDWLMEWTWRPWYKLNNLKVVRPRRVISGHDADGNRKLICEYMSRIIWAHHNGPIPGRLVIDHINWNTLDNRLQNLRACTFAQNCQHRRINPNTSSKYVGVVYNKLLRSKNKWRSVIKHEGKQLNIGSFATEIEAARAYDKVCLECRGEFAVLNFPK